MTAAPATVPMMVLRIVLPIMNFFSLARTRLDGRQCITGNAASANGRQCTVACRIENGKVGAPVKGAMLIGNGPTDLNRITMIGNDLALDHGIGTCGKNGQGVPVGVGQPTLRMERITVGGTGG